MKYTGEPEPARIIKYAGEPEPARIIGPDEQETKEETWNEETLEPYTGEKDQDQINFDEEL